MEDLPVHVIGNVTWFVDWFFPYSSVLVYRVHHLRRFVARNRYNGMLTCGQWLDISQWMLVTATVLRSVPKYLPLNMVLISSQWTFQTGTNEFWYIHLIEWKCLVIQILNFVIVCELELLSLICNRANHGQYCAESIDYNPLCVSLRYTGVKHEKVSRHQSFQIQG